MTKLAIYAGGHWRYSEQGRFCEARDHDGQPIWTQANRGVGQLRPASFRQDVSLTKVGRTLYAATGITHTSSRHRLIVQGTYRNHLEHAYQQNAKTPDL
jgi:hypothetical protein